MNGRTVAPRSDRDPTVVDPTSVPVAPDIAADNERKDKRAGESNVTRLRRGTHRLVRRSSAGRTSSPLGVGDPLQHLRELAPPPLGNGDR